MRNQVRYVWRVLAVMLCVMSVVNGDAHVLVGTKWPQANLGDPVTITYSYDNFLDGGMLRPDGSVIPVNELKGPIEEALGVWARHAPLHFVEVEDFGPPITSGAYADGDYGQIRFGHTYIGIVNGVDRKAYAYFPNPGNNQAGDVLFDNSNRWQVMGTNDLPDILGAAIHELGHSLGLNHTTDATANMYPVFLRHTGPGSGHLEQDDINGIHAIYGEGVGSVTPLSVPEPTSLVVLLTAGMLRVRRR